MVVCSAPNPYLTLLELVSEVMEALSLFFGFLKLDFKGLPLITEPEQIKKIGIGLCSTLSILRHQQTNRNINLVRPKNSRIN